jgi:peptidoglycan hydrolase-like protein with peptidoglycan-binding domain
MRKTINLAVCVLFVTGLAVSAARSQGAVRAPNKTSPTKSGTSARKGKSGKSSSRRISEIQQALSKDGSFAGTPNGKWDAVTGEAMKKFQAGHGLNPSGKLDAKTLQRLGLGSQTAGVAAPMPPTSSSIAATTPTQTARRQQ